MCRLELQTLRASLNSSEGQRLYRAFLDFHERHFAMEMAEIRGLADGSGVPLRDLFIQNIPLELEQCLSPSRPRARDDCSDFIMCSAEHDEPCVVAHNEDNFKEDLNRTVLIKARFGRRSFTAYTYLGELPSGAFGFNNDGVAFTLNWVGPTAVRCPGAGRGFLSRRLLNAPSLDAAVRVVTDATQSAGHNYQLVDTRAAVAINLEAAPDGVYAVRPASAAAFFHANEYETLSVPQTIGNSSTHRRARVAQLSSPTSSKQMLDILGDQADAKFPIFHDAVSHAAGDASGSWTLATVLFDVRAATMTVFEANPRERRVVALEKLPA
mmetsp:Transcript_36233/g.79640  ORF Transcript_36233/g.79640 Transcript_36233/m.79640 type:complete len:325 (-) Transcript_36233:302-1276(-)